ncbi:MAG: hypothetical protein K8R57_05795 [Verrucomicrobia bacterium]|nr:hypothetical protein [Verrucomicrobiota bacterium]
MGIGTPPPVNGDFVNEGTFLALPPCFPGVSLPPPADETRAHRLFQSASGLDLFVATRGPVPHLLQFRPKGTFGFAVDLGTPPGATEITALLSHTMLDGEMLLVACTGAEGAALHRSYTASLGHGIQEWHVGLRPFKQLLALPVASIDGMVESGTRIFAWGGGTGFFLNCNGAEPALEKTVQVGGIQAVLKIDGADQLLSREWEIMPILWERMEIGPAEKLPIPASTPQVLRAFPGGFLFADEEGRVFEWSDGVFSERGRIPLTPVHALCRLRDGRIFASAGPEIAHWYAIGRGGEGGWARDLGVPVSTLTTRRYGLQFSDLLVGSDGEILAAEDDRNGHLWIYFPPLNE